MDSVAEAVALPEQELVAVTVYVAAVAVALGVPVIAPLLASRDRPVGKAGLTANVRVPPPLLVTLKVLVVMALPTV